jgi:chromosomal replication initiator protein
MASGVDMTLEIAEQESARLALASDDAALIVLHGPSGGGKSFLARHSADGFDVEFLKAGEEIAREQFDDPRRDEPALLVVDDLQFLPPAAVETFCRLLDRRASLGLRTIVTASAGPRHLRFRGQPYPARLTSRLAAGNVVAVPLPGLASRRSALDALLADTDLQVPDEVIDLIARQSRSLRSLEGAVNQLKLVARLEAGPMKAGPLLRHFRAQVDGDQPKIERIVQRVAGHYRVGVKDLRSKSRQRGFVTPRHVSMYLARTLTEMSFQEIGTYFGGCDHATVVHACRKMNAAIDADPQLGGTVKQLRSDLEG